MMSMWSFLYQASPSGSNFKLVIPCWTEASSGCDCLWKVAAALFKYVMSLLRGRLADYLKECRKCTLLRFSFSGLWDAMWENSRKMSRYVASPAEENNGKHWWKWCHLSTGADCCHFREERPDLFWTGETSFIWQFWIEAVREADSRGGPGKEKLHEWHHEAFPSFNSPNSEPLLFLWPWQPPNIPAWQRRSNPFVSHESSQACLIKKGKEHSWPSLFMHVWERDGGREIREFKTSTKYGFLGALYLNLVTQFSAH